MTESEFIFTEATSSKIANEEETSEKGGRDVSKGTSCPLEPNSSYKETVGYCSRVAEKD